MSSRQRPDPWRRALAGAVGLGALALLVAVLGSPFALAAHGITTRVSVGDGDPGAESLQPSGSPSVSADGRFVAFVSGDWLDPRHPVPEIVFDNVYVRDRLTNETHLVSRRWCGPEPDPDTPEAPLDECDGGDAWEPAISADGRYVAFTSDADDMRVVNIDDLWAYVLEPQIFVHDLQAQRTIIATVVDNGGTLEPANFDSHERPSLSGDGSVLAFQRLPFTINGTLDVDVWAAELADVWAGGELVRTLVSVRACDNGCGGDAEDPVISANGRYVAFVSRADDISEDLSGADGGESISDDNGDFADVYVRDLQEQTTEIVSRNANGDQEFRNATEPSISADGSRVAFVWDFVPDEGSGIPQEVLVRDRATPTTIRVSVSSAGGEPDGWSGEPAISGNGLFVAFTSAATDLLEETETTEFPDVFVRDLAASTTMQVSVDSDDVPGEQQSHEPSISADGFVVAFTSDAENLVPEDDNGEPDVFVHDRGRPPPVILIPAASVAPDPLDFGPHLVGTTADPLPVTVVSTGTAPLVVTDVEISGGDAADFAIDSTDCVGAVLAPGAVCVVNLTFTPGDEGARTSTLLVTDNAFDSPQSVTLLGEGTEPALEVTPAVVDFGLQPLGVPTGGPAVTALSVGSGPVTITAVTLEGAHPGDFFALGGCTGATLDPAQMCIVHVSFTPTELGVRTAQLTFTHTGPSSPDHVLLTGVGAPSALQLTPDPVDFGEVLVGTTAGPLAATALNIGELPIAIHAVGVEGPHAADFTIDASACVGVNLVKDGGCMVAIELTPADVGVRTANLVVTSSAPGSPHSVVLTGRSGVQFGPAVRVTPDVTDFREVLVGATSPEAEITVTSVGTAAATISSLAIEEDDAEAFDLTGDACTGAVLQPGEACLLTVIFTPAEPGDHAAVVRVHDDAPDSPQAGALRGIGIFPQLELDPPLGRRGFVTTAIGTQFPPLAEVTLTWDRGIGQFTVTADEEGSFELVILVLRRDLLGPRELEAGGDGFSVTAEYLVVPGPVYPPEFASRS
jgi:Tol biopolymer transport system component